MGFKEDLNRFRASIQHLSPDGRIKQTNSILHFIWTSTKAAPETPSESYIPIQESEASTTFDFKSFRSELHQALTVNKINKTKIDDKSCSILNKTDTGSGDYSEIHRQVDILRYVWIGRATTTSAVDNDQLIKKILLNKLANQTILDLVQRGIIKTFAIKLYFYLINYPECIIIFPNKAKSNQKHNFQSVLCQSFFDLLSSFFYSLMTFEL